MNVISRRHTYILEVAVRCDPLRRLLAAGHSSASHSARTLASFGRDRLTARRPRLHARAPPRALFAEELDVPRLRRPRSCALSYYDIRVPANSLHIYTYIIYIK